MKRTIEPNDARTIVPTCIYGCFILVVKMPKNSMINAMKANNALTEPVIATRTNVVKAKPRVAKPSSLFFFQEDKIPKIIEKKAAKVITYGRLSYFI